MKTKTTLIAAAAALLLCLALGAWRGAEIASLEGEAARLRRELAEAPPPAAPGVSIAAPGAPPSALGAAPAEPGSRGAPTLEELVALLENLDRDEPAASLLAIPKVVDAVADCRSETLLELAGGLLGSDAEPAGFASIMLLLLVSEEDPLRALDFYDAHTEEYRGSEDARAGLLAALARIDPEAALARIEVAGMSARDRDYAQLAVARELLKTDPAGALSHMEGVGESFTVRGSGAVAVVARDPAAAERLWAEAERRGADAGRTHLLEGLMTGAALDGGLEGVDEALTRIERFAPEAMAPLLERVGRDLVEADGPGTMALLGERLPEQDRAGAMANALRSWAQKDYNAAGRWLGEQPPGRERDAMVIAFARAVSGIDPEAARAWAAEVSYPPQREALLKEIDPRAEAAPE